MILVIAEKPSVAQTIAAALGAKKKQDGYIEGNGYLISWCVGHLVQLADAAAYAARSLYQSQTASNTARTAASVSRTDRQRSA